jgi:hypothetical protein
VISLNCTVSRSFLSPASVQPLARRLERIDRRCVASAAAYLAGIPRTVNVDGPAANKLGFNSIVEVDASFCRSRARSVRTGVDQPLQKGR